MNNSRLLNDKTALRACILYEFLEGKPVFESFESFCKLIGNGILEYLEFEFWFYKLGKEAVALESELSWNPGSKSLNDMPDKIIKEVIEKHDPIDRLVLRKVSQKYRTTFDSPDPGIKSIECVLESSKVEVILKETYIKSGDINYEDYDEDDEYEDHERLKKKTIKYKDCHYYEEGFDVEVKCREQKKKLKGDLFHERAAKDLSMILKNPNLRLEEFYFELLCDPKYLDFEITDNFSSLLKLCYPIHAKQIVVDCNYKHDVSKILSLFQPKMLEHITLTLPYSTDVGTIMHLEQWKKAKPVKIGRGLEFPIEHLFHLSRFDVKLNSFSVDDAIKIRDILLKSTSFQSGEINALDFDSVEILKVFAPNYPGSGQDPIEYTTTNFKFVIEIRGSRIKFEKVVGNI